MKVTNAGYTIEVLEVYGDSQRVSFVYRVTNAQGKAIDPSLSGRIKIFDPKGNKLVVGQEDWSRNGNPSQPSSKATYSFSFDKPIVTKKIVIGLDIKTLDPYNTKIEGTWKLAIPVDLSASIKKENVVKLGQIYSFPDGTKLILKEIKNTPSRSIFSYELTPQKNGGYKDPSF